MPGTGSTFICGVRHTCRLLTSSDLHYTLMWAPRCGSLQKTGSSSPHRPGMISSGQALLLSRVMNRQRQVVTLRALLTP